MNKRVTLFAAATFLTGVVVGVAIPVTAPLIAFMTSHGIPPGVGTMWGGAIGGLFVALAAAISFRAVMRQAERQHSSALTLAGRAAKREREWIASALLAEITAIEVRVRREYSNRKTMGDILTTVASTVKAAGLEFPKAELNRPIQTPIYDVLVHKLGALGADAAHSVVLFYTTLLPRKDIPSPTSKPLPQEIALIIELSLVSDRMILACARKARTALSAICGIDGIPGSRIADLADLVKEWLKEEEPTGGVSDSTTPAKEGDA